METSAHSDKTETAERAIKLKRTAKAERHVWRQPFCRTRCYSEHLRLWINANYLSAEICKADRELTWSAPQIEHTMLLLQLHHFGDAADQFRRVGSAATTIMRSRVLEAVRFEV